MGEASDIVNVVDGFLRHIADLLRQLVHVVGWLILLTSFVSLLFHPHLSPPELYPRRRLGGCPARSYQIPMSAGDSASYLPPDEGAQKMP